MTREEADFIGAMNMCDEISNEAYTKIMCHCEEQEPCEDAISRQAALDTMYALCDTWETLKENPWRDNPHIDAIIDALDNLPPVTPQPKTGHWINKSRRSGCGILFVASECTCCGTKTPFNCDEFLYRYCPNCGAKMVEPQESESE